MKAMKRNYTVIHLDVSSNEICNDGMVSIFKGLQKNESIISLNVSTREGISRNRISGSGIVELRKTLI